MNAVYKGHTIESAVHDRADGKEFTPRAVLSIQRAGRTPMRSIDWPNPCKTKAEAEALAMQLAKQAVDDGRGYA